MSQARPSPRTSGVSSPTEALPALPDGTPAHPCGPGFPSCVYLASLIAEGDPGDLVSLLHRQMAWRGLMQRGLPASHG